MLYRKSPWFNSNRQATGVYRHMSKNNMFKKKLHGHLFFPTCQVRVVRFYVSLFSFSFSSSFLLLLSSSSSSDLNCDPVSSVWRAGPQPRSSEFSVACRTPTAILRVQCGVPDPNRDLVSSVWRAGPQLRYPRVQCGVPDPNCDHCEFSVACRTPTVMERIGVHAERVCQRSSCKMSQDKSDRLSADLFARSSERMCQKRMVKNMSGVSEDIAMSEEVQRECLGKVVRNMFKNMSARMSRSGGNLK